MDEQEKKIQKKMEHRRSADSEYEARVRTEDHVREKTDADGIRWRKVYVGGGNHFKNWLSQCIEIHGEENVQVEEIDSSGFACFEEAGEKMCRIWVKEPESGD